jgi:hypothetical protein
MSIFYDGQEPEYEEATILNQSNLTLLSIRDLCLFMRHTRLGVQAIVGDRQEYNELQLEICFLEKLIRILDKILIERFTTKADNQQFYSETLSDDLGLDGLVPGKYFDKKTVSDNGYIRIVQAANLFTNFNRCVSQDWKFL